MLSTNAQLNAVLLNFCSFIHTHNKSLSGNNGKNKSRCLIGNKTEQHASVANWNESLSKHYNQTKCPGILFLFIYYHWILFSFMYLYGNIFKSKEIKSQVRKEFDRKEKRAFYQYSPPGFPNALRNYTERLRLSSFMLDLSNAMEYCGQFRSHP